MPRLCDSVAASERSGRHGEEDRNVSGKKWSWMMTDDVDCGDGGPTQERGIGTETASEWDDEDDEDDGDGNACVVVCR